MDLRTWLLEIRRRRGYAKYLACRFIIETGVRLGETVALTDNQLPTHVALERLQLRDLLTAPIELTVTKGGRPRTIQIPISFALELRKWADTKRLKLIWLFQKRTGQPGPKELFVSDHPGHEGTHLLRHTIYEAFTCVRPSSGWSPHKGRHAYACFFILNAMEAQAQIAHKTLSEMSSGWIMERGNWWLVTLRRQLGHMSEQTTAIYLQWLMTTSLVSEAACAWHRFLNEE
jgi:integrase